MTRTFEFRLHTTGRGEAIDLTEQVESALEQSGVSHGTLVVFVPGSTGAVTTIEYESGALADLRDAIERFAPEDIPYAHNARWGDGNGHSHVRAAMIGPSLSIPIIEGRLALGTWQQPILIDFDNRSRDRRLICQVIGE